MFVKTPKDRNGPMTQRHAPSGERDFPRHFADGRTRQVLRTWLARVVATGTSRGRQRRRPDHPARGSMSAPGVDSCRCSAP